MPALRLDRRIGQYSYITPGLGISGGNLERDLQSVLRLSEINKTDGGVVASWLNNSKNRKNWPFEKLKEAVLTKKPDAAIAVLGLAYKENTHSTKNSPALLLIGQLGGCKITAYDPLVKAEAAGSSVIGAETALDAVTGADAVAIMTPWPEFREITVDSLAQRMAGRVVIDPYRNFDGKTLRAHGFTYAALGASLEGS
jgi:UDPglucose 6-dehydrogenase